VGVLLNLVLPRHLEPSPEHAGEAAGQAADV
jgi:hypothetical protein